MASVDVRTVSGGSAGSVDLPDAVFGIEPNVAVMHQVVTAQLAAARAGTQSTKTRAEVRGGGAKPWKQKGTGRARQGSTRAPHWKGGGVALGPKPRSYKQRTPKKMVQLALRSALSDRAAGGNVVVIDSWGFSGPRTKDARAALAALGVSGRVLVVLSREDDVAYKSFRNLPEVHPIPADELNAYDVLCSDWVVFTSATLPEAPEAPAKAPRAKVQMPVYATTAPVEPSAEPDTASEAPVEPAEATDTAATDTAAAAAEAPADAPSPVEPAEGAEEPGADAAAEPAGESPPEPAEGAADAAGDTSAAAAERPAPEGGAAE